MTDATTRESADDMWRGPAARPPRKWMWTGWLAALAIATVALGRARPAIEQVHVVLIYLLLVLGGSVSGGRPLGFTLAALGFGAIDYWFQLPYDTLTVTKPLDWLVLFAFLATALVTTQLLARAHAREAEARSRADEVSRMAQVLDHAVALREADRMKDMLLASVSHDFRTPLTTIKVLADDIAHTPAADDANVSSTARIIAEQADRLTHLVDNVLDLSRIRGGSLRVNPEINTAEDLVGAAVRQVGGVLREHALDVQIDWNAPALTGYFDFPHSLRALGNLLENAAKYSAPGAPITITVQADASSLAMSVADRGAGVAAAEQPRIFEAFYRPVNSLPDAGSAGLGLAIARQLAEVQGGSVDYAPREGGGSVFTLRLPIATSCGEDEST